MDTLPLIIIAALCFGVRAYPRLKLRDALASDTFFHLYVADLLRRNDFKIPKRLNQVVLDHDFSYPYLYHWFLALFPLSTRLWVERLTGAIFDTTNAVIIYLFSSWLVARYYPAGAHDSAPLIVTALYAFAPSLLRMGSGPRAYNGSARVPGATLYMLHLTCGFYALETSSAVAAVASLVSAALIFLTSIFGIQVLLFFGVMVTLFVMPLYPFFLLAAFGVAYLISGGMAWQCLKGQTMHRIFYYRHLQQIFLYPHIRTWSQYKAEVAKYWAAFKAKRYGETLNFMLKERHWAHLLLTAFPHFVLVPWFLFDTIAHGGPRYALLVWTMSGIVFFAATKTKRLLFLGEGERYLEFSIFPSLFFVATACPTFVPALLLIYSLICLPFFLRDYARSYGPLDRDFKKATEMYEVLSDLPSGVILPVGWVHWQALYRTPFPVLTYGGNIDLNIVPLDTFMLVYGNYPYPGADFARIVETFDVAYVLADRGCLNHYLAKILKRPEDFLESVIVLKETETLLLFTTKRSLAERYQSVESHIQAGRLEDAERTISDILKFAPDDGVLRSLRAQVLLEIAATRAIEEFQLALAAPNCPADTAIHLANTLLTIGRQEEARAVISDALRRAPHDAELLRTKSALEQPVASV